jgi:UDP-2-acetamido-3-amino-2,3-dideoxy-glucuronate N-acetyltransferase
MIGAGSVVTGDIPDYGLVWGNPARLYGYVCPCGTPLEVDKSSMDTTTCSNCGLEINIIIDLPERYK